MARYAPAGMLKVFASLCVLGILLLGHTKQIQATPSTPFSFALMGDQPYNSLLEPATDSLIQHMNSDPEVQWILHIGDIKGGAEPCSDELLKRRIDQMNSSSKPLVYVPGDNEWTDCHRESNGNFNTQERLNFIRTQAFARPHTLGQINFVVRQQKSHPYPEHLMWQQGSTLFISLNVPGSNNDLLNPVPRKTSAAEARRLLQKRDAAIADWLQEGEQLFDKSATALTETVVAIQGNPIDGSGSGKTDGYANFMKTLVAFIDNTNRPVLLVHGDTHTFKWDKPALRKYGATAETEALFYRVEGWGHPFVNSWVKVTVTPGLESPFKVESISQTAEVNN